MASNDRTPAHGLPDSEGVRPAGSEETIKTERLQVERKSFVFSLKENPRGRFLRITEDVGGRRDSIIVPSTGLDEFQRVIVEMVQASAQTPPKTHQP